VRHTSRLVRIVRRLPLVLRDVAFLFGSVAICAACGGGAGGSVDAQPIIDAGPRALRLELHRVAGARAFDAVAMVDWPEGPAAPVVALTADHGDLAPPITTGTTTTARLTPTATGNYVITASLDRLTVVRTAIVLGQVDDVWDQPEAVRGLVNTAGWEDGPSISPDGSVLTLQYLPVPIDCVLGGDPSAPACHVTGPSAAPERPDLPGASRIHADGTYLNGCPSVGVASLPAPAPPNSLYAFRREADGSFDQPHRIYFAGADGCSSAFGLQLIDAAGDAVYAFDDLRHAGEGARLYRTTIDPSVDRALGTFSLAGSTINLDLTGSSSIGDPAGPVQGNPHEYRPAGGGVILFSDDEQGRQDLFDNTAPSEAGPWTGQQLIPAPISVANAQESQPFFDGHTLWFRRGLVILGSDWNGGVMTSGASWSAPRTILAPDTAETAIGTIAVVGEPSVSTAASPRELYFVYGRRTAAGTLDLDIGHVAAR
jgi:hypothetical protein